EFIQVSSLVFVSGHGEVLQVDTTDHPCRSWMAHLQGFCPLSVLISEITFGLATSVQRAACYSARAHDTNMNAFLKISGCQIINNRSNCFVRPDSIRSGWRSRKDLTNLMIPNFLIAGLPALS